jgi:hypothetical protein
VLHQGSRIHAAKIEPLAARQDRDRNLADLGSGENKLGVWRGLFQRLEQSIEGLRREHMHLVENVDLVACAHRRIADRVVDLAHILDTVVGRGIHFDHVKVATFHDRLAMDAKPRHVDGRARDGTVRKLVIESARQNASCGRFADAAHTGQNPRLRDPASRNRIRDSLNHRVLPDQLIERRRAVFTG